MNFTEHQIKILVNQPPQKLREGLAKSELLDMIVMALHGNGVGSFVVEFDRHITPDEPYGDFATVRFMRSGPVRFAMKAKETGDCVGCEILDAK
jgi:hypothetical protein